METGPCLFTTEGGQSWHSVQDVMNSLGSLTLFPGGSKDTEKTDKRKKVYVPVEKITSRTRGRGETMNVMENSSVMARDAALQRDLRAACGRGFSNELIEHYWGTNTAETSADDSSDCSQGQFNFNMQNFSNQYLTESKSGQSTSDSRSYEYDSDSEPNIGFRSKISKVPTHNPPEKSSDSQVNKRLDSLPVSFNGGWTEAPIEREDELNCAKSNNNKIAKKKPPKCRNALILGLQRRDQYEMFPHPQDRPKTDEEVPLSIPSKNNSTSLYSFVVSQSTASKYKGSDQKKDNLKFNLFDDEFPPLS